jgi:hypothetical protein
MICRSNYESKKTAGTEDGRRILTAMTAVEGWVQFAKEEYQ